MSTSWLPADSRMLPPSASLWSKHRSFTRWSQAFWMFFLGGFVFPTMKMPGKNWIWMVPLLLEIHPIFPLNHDYGRNGKGCIWKNTVTWMTWWVFDDFSWFFLVYHGKWEKKTETGVPFILLHGNSWDASCCIMHFDALFFCDKAPNHLSKCYCQL